MGELANNAATGGEMELFNRYATTRFKPDANG